MSRKRLRPIARGQGWIESTQPHLAAIRDAIVSDQPESVMGFDGRVRVHKLEPFPPKPEVERVNVSGKIELSPVGVVRKPAR